MQENLWSLVHDIKGLGDRYDASFERPGILVERGWMATKWALCRQIGSAKVGG